MEYVIESCSFHCSSWHAVVVNITGLDATELSGAIHDRSVSCREVMSAYLDRIDARNDALNAIVSLRDQMVPAESGL